jgi:uncharacterized protein YdhG (YjbR/CyaY superfamily)
MTKIQFNTVDDYIASQPEEARRVVEQVRSAIRKALPGAKESITYHMPTYKADGEVLIYFAAWKRHFSLYPASAQLLEQFKDDLARYEINKSTIRFPLSERVPVKLIDRIAKYRVKEVARKKRPT